MVSALSHTGCCRANNEDHYLVARLGGTLETVSTSLLPGDVPERTEEVNHLMIVADGMGGHQAGEIASRMAISTLVSLALEVPDWIMRIDDAHAQEVERRSRSRVQEVDAMLVESGQRDPSLAGMGTTLTAARSLGRDLVITHVATHGPTCFAPETCFASRQITHTRSCSSIPGNSRPATSPARAIVTF